MPGVVRFLAFTPANSRHEVSFGLLVVPRPLSPHLMRAVSSFPAPRDSAEGLLGGSWFFGGGVTDLAGEHSAVLAEEIHVGVTTDFATHGLNKSHRLYLTHNNVGV